LTVPVPVNLTNSLAVLVTNSVPTFAFATPNDAQSVSPNVSIMYHL